LGDSVRLAHLDSPLAFVDVHSRCEQKVFMHHVAAAGGATDKKGYDTAQVTHGRKRKAAGAWAFGGGDATKWRGDEVEAGNGGREPHPKWP
jgi:hypothetical protein